ncbi:amidohydrolase family protein [Lysobacter koreensis]|uniref:Amidohydrolase family protein n=1 Tax=Lysobacter koreensis TaxID=266122 RepID=A0ABW2YQ64_9GAMM
MTGKGAVAATLLGAALAFATFGASAQDLLIRNATVHTAGAQGSLQNADVLVSGGKVRAVGTGLVAPANAQVVDAQGRPLTPTLFGGITQIGLEEVSGEKSTVDETLALGAEQKEMTVRPEFDVTLAYNPESILIPVARVEGIGWTLLGAGTASGGSIVAGQGGAVRLDGGPDPIGPRVLFVKLGGDASGLTGNSRAAQWMILDQLIDEVRGRIPADANAALLTPAGRATLARYIGGGGRVVVSVNRAADIRQLLRWSARHQVRIAIAGGAEAWKLAPQLAAAKVPVFVDPLANLPADFDELGATMENAARLRAAGVAVAFSQAGDGSHNARKVRQLAGNAVAAGLPWADGLAGLTTVPAEAFGVAGELGRIAPGQRADLVLWSGDPLEVNSVALQVWLDGRAITMRSRQTELRDRYLRGAVPAELGGLPRAYPGTDTRQAFPGTDTSQATPAADAR